MYQDFQDEQLYQAYSYHTGSYTINEYQNYSQNEIETQTIKDKMQQVLEIIASKSDLKNQINKSDILKQFKENEHKIVKILEDQGYKLEGIVNGGGFSILISAQSNLNKDIVIKIFENNQNQNEIVNKEKEIYKLLNEGKKQKYFIELIEHITIFENWDAFIYKKYKCLQNVIREKDFPEQNMLTFIFDLIHGLIDLRRASIIHLDIKIENILINEQGNLIYCDFGISEIKKQNQIVKCRGYTKDYSPKEQIDNNSIDFESDVYSLGKTLQFLAELFIKNNPSSLLITFVEDLLNIIKDQMILEDIQDRPSCYEVHSQVYQLFKAIPQKFISQHQECIEQLNKEIRKYLGQQVDEYFEDIYQDLNQVKNNFKKAGNFKGFKNSQYDQNKQQIKKLIQGFQDYSNYNDQSKECLSKQVQQELQYLQERFSTLTQNIKKNNILDMNSIKECENFQIKINKIYLDLKEHFIMFELSEIQESSNQVLIDFNNSVLKLKSIDNKFKVFINLLKNPNYKLQNSILENLIKEIDEFKIENIFRSIEELDQFLINQYGIESIAKYLKELKSEKATDFICLLKDPSIQIQDLKKLQNYLIEQQSSKQHKNALGLAQNGLKQIGLFEKEIKKVIIQEGLKQYSLNEFKEFLEYADADDDSSIQKDFDILNFCIQEYLMKISTKDREGLSQI
ncbi:hypothetical protein ABPG72_001078 [Tetrahymena utriculariae]